MCFVLWVLPSFPPSPPPSPFLSRGGSASLVHDTPPQCIFRYYLSYVFVAFFSFFSFLPSLIIAFPPFFTPTLLLTHSLPSLPSLHTY